MTWRQLGRLALHRLKRGFTDLGVRLSCKITSSSSTVNIPYCFDVHLYSVDLTTFEVRTGHAQGPKFLSVATSWNCRAASMKSILARYLQSKEKKNEKFELNGIEQQ